MAVVTYRSTSEITITAKNKFEDNVKLTFGDDDDAFIRWNGSNLEIELDGGGSAVDATLGRFAKVKAADQIVNNSETLVDDDTLFFAVGADENWHFRVYMRVSSFLSTTPDMDFQFGDLPAGGQITGWFIGDIPGIADAGQSPPSVTAQVRLPLLTNDTWFIFDGQYIGGSVAGTVQLQWAQGVATVENTIMHAESMILATRLS